MWLRVASLLGRTVEELQAEMSAAEFADWCAFYDLEPWGFAAENWRMSIVAATTANYSGRAKKALKPSDFLPRPRRKQSAADMKRALAMAGHQGQPTNGE